MKPARAIDVHELPDHAFGSRDPMWWAQSLMMCIEGTMMLLLLVSYFYLRGHFEHWPPTGLGVRSTRFAAAGAVALALSGLALYAVSRVTRRERLGLIRTWMTIGSLLSIGVLVLRFFELRDLPVRWATHAYGSVLWLTLGMHTLHVFVGTYENCLITALTLRGRLEPKHFVDIYLNALFWLFVVIEWLPIGAVLYGEGGSLGL